MAKKYATLQLTIHCGKIDQTNCTDADIEVLTNRPVIYIYFGRTSFYVGQSNQFLSRHVQHMGESNVDYNEFDNVIILFGQYVDGNSKDDIESMLITYLTADSNSLPANQQRISRNRVKGNRVVEYPTKANVYAEVLVPFWENELKELGMVSTTKISNLRQSILFRYSPFTELTQQQAKIIEDVLSIERSFLIKGGAGTGKTVLLTNLVARFSETIQVGVVVKNNWIGTLKKILKAYPVGNNIDVGSAYQIITNNKKYDIIIVDEAHRLRWGYPKQDHKRFGIFDKNEPKKNELYLLGEKTERLVLLYDSLQTIRPSDIPRSDFESYIKEKSFLGRTLSKQFRVQIKDAGACYTAEDYIRGMQCFLQLENQSYDKRVFQNKAPDAYFGVTNSIYELFEYVDRQRQYNPVKQCRVLAGYARPWNSKRKPDHKKYTEFDWVEGKNSWKWNSTQEDWISRPGSEDEIGSIHAVQGVDLDYVGLIVANDLTYKDGQVMAIKENYYDVNGTPVIKGFSLEELTQYIKQIYYVLLTRGICGIRVYFEDEALRKHFMEEVGLNEQGNH